MNPDDFQLRRDSPWQSAFDAEVDALVRAKANRTYSDEQLRKAIERLSRCGPEHLFDDSMTDWDRDFLRTNRIQP